MRNTLPIDNQDSSWSLNEKLKAEKKKAAFEMALDTRKFEITLYWTRATYFWTFIVVLLGAYGGLLISGEAAKKALLQSLGLLFIAGSGCVFSLAWVFVNRASKFWQKNWEWHVDILEDDQVGEVYRRVYTEKKLNILDSISAYPFSISNINALLSTYVFIVFVSLFLASISLFLFRVTSTLGLSIIPRGALPYIATGVAAGIIVFSIGFCIHLMQRGVSGSHNNFQRWLKKVDSDSEDTNESRLSNAENEDTEIKRLKDNPFDKFVHYSTRIVKADSLILPKKARCPFCDTRH